MVKPKRSVLKAKNSSPTTTPRPSKAAKKDKKSSPDPAKTKAESDPNDFPGFETPKPIVKPLAILDFPPLDDLNPGPEGRQPLIYTFVNSLAITKFRDEVWFKCFQPKCPFIMPNMELFVEHLKERHSKVAWTGLCVTCVAIVCEKTTILGEMEHLLWHKEALTEKQ